MIKKIILGCGFFFLYSSCDVPGYLQVQNCTSSKVQYVTYFKSQNNVKDTLVIEIPANETKGGILFGFGVRWRNADIKHYVSTIDKLEIIVKNDTTVISESDQMISYFKARRKGLFRERMKIKIK